MKRRTRSARLELVGVDMDAPKGCCGTLHTAPATIPIASTLRHPLHAA